VNQLVLSGTATLVPSGTGSSCYRGPESVLSACCRVRSSRRNSSNQKSFGFLLTDRAVFPTVHNPLRDLRTRPLALDLQADGAAL
jgi:hypothetical protein